jgi:hypothetical protein
MGAMENLFVNEQRSVVNKILLTKNLAIHYARYRDGDSTRPARRTLRPAWLKSYNFALTRKFAGHISKQLSMAAAQAMISILSSMTKVFRSTWRGKRRSVQRAAQLSRCRHGGTASRD